MTRRKVAALGIAVMLVLALTLAFAGQAVGATGGTQWVCKVPDEGTVTFVSASGAAHDGIVQANSTAGETFNEQFGEKCRVK